MQNDGTFANLFAAEAKPQLHAGALECQGLAIRACEGRWPGWPPTRSTTPHPGMLEDRTVDGIEVIDRIEKSPL
jgi:hypothetical protein